MRSSAGGTFLDSSVFSSQAILILSGRIETAIDVIIDLIFSCPSRQIPSRVSLRVSARFVRALWVALNGSRSTMVLQ